MSNPSRPRSTKECRQKSLMYGNSALMAGTPGWMSQSIVISLAIATLGRRGGQSHVASLRRRRPAPVSLTSGSRKPPTGTQRALAGGEDRLRRGEDTGLNRFRHDLALTSFTISGRAAPIRTGRALPRLTKCRIHCLLQAISMKRSDGSLFIVYFGAVGKSSSSTHFLLVLSRSRRPGVPGPFGAGLRQFGSLINIP
jgi:hypothetical protein